MTEPIEILQERIAALETQLQTYANRTWRLEADMPKGMMLPYFRYTLPESGDYVWADGQTTWPKEDWVPEELRGKPVPDMREQLVGGAPSPDDKSVGKVWSEGIIPIPATSVKGERFKLQGAKQETRSVAASGIMGLRLTEVSETDNAGNENPLPLDRPRLAQNRVIGRGAYSGGGLHLAYATPSLDEVKYTDTSYPETLTGEAQIDEHKVHLKDAATNPPHVRANWIIRVK